MSGLFKKCDDADQAIISVPGGEKQVDLYTRNGILYVKDGGLYLRLMANGGTTKPKVQLVHLEYDGPLMKDSVGRLCTPEARGAVPLPAERRALLIGESTESGA